MKRISATLMLFAVILGSASAQDTVWTRHHGGPYSDRASSLCSTHDGKFLATGFSFSYSSPEFQDVYLVKFDVDGDTVWTRTFGEAGMDDYVYHCDNTYDNGFVIAGMEALNLDNQFWFLTKLDQEGSKIWERNYFSLAPQSRLRYVEETSDSGFILAGYSGLGVQWGDYSVVIIKTDSLGEGDGMFNTEWMKTYDISYNVDNRAYCARQTSDGGFIVAGATGAEYVMDMFLLRLNQYGDSIWCQTYESPSGDSWGWSVEQTADGGFLIVGFDGLIEYDKDAYVVRTDHSGNELYSWKYDLGFNNELFVVEKDPSGGFIAAGTSSSNALLMRLDETGDTLWYFTYGTVDFNCAYGVIPAGSGEFFTAGWSEFPADFYMARIALLPSYVCGDADASDGVDIDDAVYLIAYIFSGGPPPEPLESGDADCSGAADIDDVVYLIGFIFSGGNEPCDTDGDGEPEC